MPDFSPHILVRRQALGCIEGGQVLLTKTYALLKLVFPVCWLEIKANDRCRHFSKCVERIDGGVAPVGSDVTAEQHLHTVITFVLDIVRNGIVDLYEWRSLFFHISTHKRDNFFIFDSMYISRAEEFISFVIYVPARHISATERAFC